MNQDDFNSDDEREIQEQPQVPWYQFNTHTFTVQAWDSFFAVIILLNVIMTPLSIVFPEHFHEDEDAIDWLALEMFLNALWVIDFFINLNRVDFVRKIDTCGDTTRAYLRGTMIPDAIALIGAISACIAGKFYVAKYFDLIRLIRFRDALYPVNLCVIRFTNNGKKRISQIQSLIFVFYAFITLGHLAACTWIKFGVADKDLPATERESWFYVNDFNGMSDE